MEYIALSKEIATSCWIINLLNEIGLECKQVIIFANNKSSVHISQTREKHKRLKHVDSNFLTGFDIPSEEQITDSTVDKRNE